MRKIGGFFLCISIGLAIVVNSFAATKADIGFVIDQSESMGGEFEWLADSLAQMDGVLRAGGLTYINYGVAGYDYYAGTEPKTDWYLSSSPPQDNVWQDLTPDFSLITGAVNGVQLYGGLEQGYNAAQWAADNFSWTGGEFSKILVLITDENAEDSKSGFPNRGPAQAVLGQNMIDAGILLNVITDIGFYSNWTLAVHDQSDPHYQGIFDLNYLRTDPASFTTDFATAKLFEIQGDAAGDPAPIPEPSSWILLGTALVTLGYYRRKNS